MGLAFCLALEMRRVKLSIPKRKRGNHFQSGRSDGSTNRQFNDLESPDEGRDTKHEVAAVFHEKSFSSREPTCAAFLWSHAIRRRVVK
jgi:hypothetical protein